MFTLAICTILNGYTRVNIKILLIQSYHTTCVSFSCEFYVLKKVFNLSKSLVSEIASALKNANIQQLLRLAAAILDTDVEFLILGPHSYLLQ